MSKEYLERRQKIRAAARKRRKRVLAVIVLILLLFVFVGGFFCARVHKQKRVVNESYARNAQEYKRNEGRLEAVYCIRCLANSEKEYVTYTVGYGDTLWSIAREIYGDSCDIRYKIDDIERENGIMDSTIYPGMQLLVEVE